MLYLILYVFVLVFNNAFIYFFPSLRPFLCFRDLSGCLQIEMKTVFIYDLLFIFYVICIHLTAAVEDTHNDVKNLKEFRNVLELLQVGKKKLELSSNDLLSNDIYFEIMAAPNKKIDVVFNELKKEFDVASCIFKGVAYASTIESAAIYLHTTKYVFTSLRYSLDLYSEYKSAGKMEKELAPFALVLNSVLLHGSEKVSKMTYSGEDFMCKSLSEEVKDNDIFVFHTFMPSSENLKIAMEYAAKKGDSSCIYVFTNTESQYSPRNIKKLSYEPNDEEAVFPIGAAFRKIKCKLDAKTTATVNKKRVVCLKLLPDQERPKTLNEQDQTCTNS